MLIRRKLLVVSALALVLLLSLAGWTGAQDVDQAAPQAPSVPLGTAFTYQGRLSGAGGPVDDTCSFTFRLYDGAEGGTLVGTEYKPGVEVSGGFFAVELDFGAGAFAGDARWLEIDVDCGEGPATLSPRQALTPTPYGLYARSAPWSGLSGMPSGFADGVDDGLTSVHWSAILDRPAGLDDGDNDTTYGAGNGLSLIGNQFSVAFAGSGSTSTVAHSDHSHSGSYWSLSGNSGAVPPGNFLGTTDSQPLELRVNNARVLRLEPAASPNLVGGYGGNSTMVGVQGAAIGGGGSSGNANQVSDHWGTVAGGMNNRAGNSNEAVEDAIYATVGGGRDNVASGTSSVVTGGDTNTASGWRSTVPGGVGNVASGAHSFAAGRRAKANHEGAFVWADSLNADFGSTNTNQFLIRASGGVGIGTNNPQAQFHVGGTSQFDGVSQFNLGVGSVSLSTPGGWPGMIAFSPNGHRRDIVFKDDRLALLTSGSSSTPPDTSGIVIREDGKVGIGTDAPTTLLDVAGTSRFAGVSQFNLGAGSISMSTPGGWPGMIAFSPNGHRREIVFKDDRMSLLTSSSSSASSDTNGIVIRENGWVGIGTTGPAALLDVAGTAQVDVLQIMGGSDLAEPFEVAGAEQIQPGMVLAIDPEHPGQLRVADRAYDRTVAGCVSGANRINPGLVMQQEGSAAAGSFPVALSGRVYCWADASQGAIQPGDLLTTSNTAGHAMKASDYQKAQGAILGKAMSTLDEGQGLILVLVTLQ